ncbi:MAG: cysteine hydrolase family protein [Nitrososphaerales archaeon]
MKEAIIVDDILEEFVYGKISSPRAKNIVRPTKKLLEKARSVKIPVIYVCDAHLSSDPEMRVWGPHAMKGTKGAQVVKDLSPQKSDYVLEKRVYSSFQGTGLELLLRDLRVDTVVIVGLLTEICVRHSAADAFMRGFKIQIPQDCVEALSEKAQSEGLQYLKSIYGAEITTSTKLVQSWKK